LDLQVTRQGDKLTLKTTFGGLQKPGAKVKLRLAVVEEVVRYPGGNGQRLHYQVVRGFAGGLGGIALEKESGRHEATIDVAKLRKTRLGDLERYSRQMLFLDGERPLALKALKVVAFIQDDATKKVLQAVQADVPEPK